METPKEVKYYQKPYKSRMGFSTFFKVTDENIFYITVFDDGAINIYHHEPDDLMMNSEIKYCKSITEKEFIDAIIILKKLLS